MSKQRLSKVDFDAGMRLLRRQGLTPAQVTMLDAVERGHFLRHVLLIQGQSAECPKCGMSGNVQGQTGDIFSKECGEVS